jgi:exopolysaccharide production protein ExoZ
MLGGQELRAFRLGAALVVPATEGLFGVSRIRHGRHPTAPTASGKQIHASAPTSPERRAPAAAGRPIGPDGTLASLQYLRAAAALAVTLYHALQWCDGGFEIGRAGVDVFFVISGVVMWRVTAGRRISPLAFLLRRATRVAPLYWLATLLVFGLALAWRGFLPEVIPEGGHLALSLAFVPHLDPLGRPFPLLPPGWTLTYEALFYGLFAAALTAPRRWRALTVTAGLTLLVAAGFMLADPVYILGGNPMLLQFAAGVWLGVAMETGALPGRAWAVAWMLVGAGLFAALQISGFVNELWRPLLWGAPATLLVMGALGVEADGGVPRLGGALALGDASYALYLVHLPATALIAHTLGWREPWLFVILATLFSIACALACHAWLERPMIAAVRRHVSVRS